MSSIVNQIRLKNTQIKKKSKLNSCPQKKGTCVKVFTMSPKKPNSACRKVAKVFLLSIKTQIHCHIPGMVRGVMPLQRYATVLVRGGRVKDLPGVKNKVVRGAFDLKPVFGRIKARSKYGIKKN